ncbi:MAG TPA: serine protease [Candidatus Limnocylindrales bacterium]|nr:serine protease [Candidatus Limnocylindrales bacterium]
MFINAAAEIRESLYGVIAKTVQGGHALYGIGSGVMITPHYVITNAHVIHVNSDVANKTHQTLEVVRSPDIGKKCTVTTLHKEDPVRDLALLKIEDQTSTRSVALEDTKVPSGTMCGSLGFPLSKAEVVDGALRFRLTERFQGAFISAYFTVNISGRPISWYEVDRVMYGGSSGCPFFLENGRVIGLQTRVRTDTSKAETPVEKRDYLAISLLIPSPEIVGFAKSCGVI